MMIAKVGGILLLLVVMAAVSLAVQAATRISTEGYVQRMTEATVSSWPELAKVADMTRVFEEIQLLATDGRRAWLMNAVGGQEVDIVAVQAFKGSSEYGRFQKVEWRGRPAVLMGMGERLPADEVQRLDDSNAVPYLFTLATHEAFHFYSEAGWTRELDSERSTAYPAKVEPRWYRGAMIRQLLAAARGQADAIGRASGWYRRWSSEFADEARSIRGTDRSEGAARYTELVAQLLAQGLRPDTPQWAQGMLMQLAQLGEIDHLSADHESYTLGVLTGVLLDRQGLDWLPRVAQGETALDLLFAGVEPLGDRVDERANTRVQEALTEANRKAAQVFDPFLMTFNDPAGRRLLIPHSTMRGSFGSGGSYRLASMAETIETGVRAGFAVKQGRIDFSAMTVATHITSACGAEDLYWMLALTNAELKRRPDGRMRFTRDGLEVDIPYPVAAADNEQWFCVQA